MFHPLSLFIGLRYTAAKRKNNFISFISIISIGGIALGIMTMIVVLSVMNGFQKGIREGSLSMAYHNKVLSAKRSIEHWNEAIDLVLKVPNVVGAAPFNDGKGLLSAIGVMKAIQIQGINPELNRNVSDFDKNVSANGKADLSILKPREFGIILGKDLAANLKVKEGDYVSLITSEINVTAAGVMPRIKRMKVVGTFDVKMYEYDANIALMNIDDVGILFRIPKGHVEGIRLKLNDVLEARSTAQMVADTLDSKERVENGTDFDARVYSWIDEFAALFKMIEVEKTTMFVIMSLIVAVAVFNIVSTLVMVVTDKRAEIAILRTLGMSPKEIMVIFMVQGVVIGFFGALIGIVLGILIAFNVNTLVKGIESILGRTLFEPSVYPLSEIPAEVLWGDVLSIAGIAFLLASLATLYPAWKAARTQPAEALRYE